MAYCRKCGAELSEGSKFCRKCGAANEAAEMQGRRVAAKRAAQSSTRPVNGPSRGHDGSPSHSSASAATAKKRPIPFIIGGCALAVLAVAAIIAFSLFNPFVPPALAEETVIGDLRTDELAKAMALENDWGRQDGFAVTEKTVDFIEDALLESEEGKRTQTSVVYENGDYRITARYISLYANQDNQWTCYATHEEERNCEPLSGLDDETVLSKTASYMNEIDKTPYKDAEGKSKKLGELYKVDFKNTIEENAIEPSGGNASIAISASNGLARYSGTITVEYQWAGNDWKLVGCSADKNAYQPDYSGLVGQWRGTFAGLKSNHYNLHGKCYGGRNEPVTMSIKSVDSNAKTAVVDASFLVHDHDLLANDQVTTEGDSVVHIVDAIITLKPNETSYYEVYRDNYNGRLYKLLLKNDSDGKIGLCVFTYRSASSHEDMFDLEKIEV